MVEGVALEIHSVNCLENAINPCVYAGLRDFENLAFYRFLRFFYTLPWFLKKALCVKIEYGDVSKWS